MITTLELGQPGGVVALIDVNPLHWLGDQAKESLADGFASMMMGIWSGAMWLLQAAFSLLDSFTPNVADPGLTPLYSVTVWISLAIALVVAVAQIGLAVARQDGRGFGTLATGVVQYGVVLACWIGVCAGLVAGASGLTAAILHTLLGVDSFSGYAAGDGFVDTVSGTVQASTLGLCALFILIPAAFGHMVIMLVRSAALLILTATMPIAAAGALSEGTRSWMWKSIRWFLACTLMEPLLALVIGMGTKFAWAGMPDGAAQGGAVGGESSAGVGGVLSSGVGGGLGGGVGDGASSLAGSSTAENIGISVVGSVILLVACFTPLVLFRLLAFVDPGTASGASFRTTMHANGGAAGLLQGRRAGAHGAASGSGAASETASDGRTSSENGAETETAHRWHPGHAATASSSDSEGGRRVSGRSGGRSAGILGGLAGGGMAATGRIAQVGASMAVDVLGQSGIGNQGYYDTSYSPRTRQQAHAYSGQTGQPGQSGQPGQPGRPGGQHRRPGTPQEFEKSGRNDEGIANDIPPEAQSAVEDGVFLA